jgi:RimJ/RimL family protein N-acetyltransferase
MNIIYREVDSKSFEEVRQLLVTHEYSFRDSNPKDYIPKSQEQRDKSARNYMELLDSEPKLNQGLCAFLDDEIIGSHLLEIYPIDNKKSCHVHGLWINNKFRNNGIATKLKDMGEVWAKTQKCEIMDSNVDVTNNEMISLNKKLGYEIVRYNFRKNLNGKF